MSKDGLRRLRALGMRRRSLDGGDAIENVGLCVGKRGYQHQMLTWVRWAKRGEMGAFGVDTFVIMSKDGLRRLRALGMRRWSLDGGDAF